MGHRHGKHSLELTEKQIFVLKRKTKLSADEIRHLHQSFIRDNPTGRLDQETYLKTMKTLVPDASLDRTLKYNFHRLDRNGDGFVDFGEFLLSIVFSSEGTWEEQLGDIFDTCDLSDDGFVDVDELEGFIQSKFEYFGLPEFYDGMNVRERANRILSKLDKKGTGKIRKSDFISEFKNPSDLYSLMFPLWSSCSTRDFLIAKR